MTALHTHLGEGRIRVLEGELAAVRGELTRLDAKCGTLVAIAGAGLALLAGQIGKVRELPVQLALVAAVAALAAAAVVLLAGVLRPRLGPTGFNRWATLPVDQIEKLFRCGRLRVDDDGLGVEVGWLQPGDLHVLSLLVVRKQRRLRAAVDLLVAAVLLTAAAPLTGVIA